VRYLRERWNRKWGVKEEANEFPPTTLKATQIQNSYQRDNHRVLSE